MEEQSMKPTVMLVDDTPANLRLLQEILQNKGYRVLAFLGGRMALSAALRNPPDLLLLDITMPEMDGFEVCTKLKTEAKLKDIPVIFISALNDTANIVRAFACGGVDFVTKPFQHEEVLARVGTHLELRQARLSLDLFSRELGKYIPSQVYQSLLSGGQKVSLRTTRKKLTVFFSDIVNFTRTTETLESEDLTQLLNSYLNRMAIIAHRHGGTLDKFIGDAVMIFFGDPESRGLREDALACVSMAVEMRQALEDLREEWRRDGHSRGFSARMGIATGFCTVGNFGSEDRMNYTILGSTVNLASRLESSAEPDQIVVSEETKNLIEANYLCRELAPRTLKGYGDQVLCYAVLDPKDSQYRRNTRLDLKGCSLRLDLDRLEPTARAEVASTLEALLATLKKEES